MFNDIPKLLLGLALLGPGSALADIIHWEAHSEEDTPAYMGENFLLDGGFDFNSTTGAISNITVKTSSTDGCVACNDFANGGTAIAFTYKVSESESYGGGIAFYESYGPKEFSSERVHNLYISGPGLNPFIPGTYENLNLEHAGYILQNDPNRPFWYDYNICYGCVSLTGTLVPIPEPETYALMLAGLGMLGWRAKRKAGINA